MTRRSAFLLTLAAALPSIGRAQTARAPVRADYQWSRERDSAAFEGSYNFPVFVVRGEMWAFHPRGGWSSRDGRTWARSELPASGKYSVNENGTQRFIYRNDVWSMSPRTR